MIIDSALSSEYFFAIDKQFDVRIARSPIIASIARDICVSLSAVKHNRPPSVSFFETWNYSILWIEN